MTPITIDPRAGSSTLVKPLRALGVPVEVEHMEYGDVAFFTHDCRRIGLEHKRLDDVLTCIVDGRFAGHQLPGMWANYDVVWLIVQGEYRCGPWGELLVRRKLGRWGEVPGERRQPWFYSRVEHWLNTMRFEGGVSVYLARDLADSAAFIRAQYTWWQQASHSSLKVFAEHAPPRTVTRPGITRRMAKEIPGIEWELSARCAAHFQTPRRMVNASAAEWMTIPGIGEKIARRTVWLMENGKENGR